MFFQNAIISIKILGNGGYLKSNHDIKIGYETEEEWEDWGSDYPSYLTGSYSYQCDQGSKFE